MTTQFCVVIFLYQLRHDNPQLGQIDGSIYMCYTCIRSMYVNII